MANILVLDDDPQILKMARLMLEKAGHQVDIAENGALGLEKLSRSRPDLLITDILMPEMDGIDFINHCRREKLGLKIIAMSGGRRKISSEFNLKSARMLGASASLEKPFTQAELMDCVRGLI